MARATPTAEPGSLTKMVCHRCPTRATTRIKGPLRCLHLSLARQGPGHGARSGSQDTYVRPDGRAEHQIMKDIISHRVSFPGASRSHALPQGRGELRRLFEPAERWLSWPHHGIANSHVLARAGPAAAWRPVPQAGIGRRWSAVVVTVTGGSVKCQALACCCCFSAAAPFKALKARRQSSRAVGCHCRLDSCVANKVRD